MVKRIIIKAILVILAFFVTIAIYLFGALGVENAGTAGTGELSIPVLGFMINDTEMNITNGYTMEMDASYIRDSITVVDSSRALTLVIHEYDNEVKSVGYEITTLDGDTLIEDKEITELNEDSNILNPVIKLTGMVKSDTEYCLKVKITTEEGYTAYYYTRLLVSAEADISEHLEFMEYFHEGTFDKTLATELASYLSYDSSITSTDLGTVDMYSKKALITWGNMEPEVVSDIKITIKEMYDVYGEYVLEYVVRAADENDVYSYYNVREFYRLRQGNTQMFVQSFERTVDEIFSATSSNIGTSAVTLGIDSDGEIAHRTSTYGTYTCFVKERCLYVLDLTNNICTKVYSLDMEDYTDLRATNKNADISIVTMKNTGDVVFMVCGYMNTGDNAGQNGVSVFLFDYSENSVEELVFIPSSLPYDILKDYCGELTYVDDDGLVYIKLEDALYKISVSNKESLQIVENLTEGTYAVNQNGYIIAWHEDLMPYTKSIRVLNCSTGEQYTIMADDGEYLVLQGFVTNDLVYGVVKEDKIVTSGDTNIFYMYELRIHISAAEEEIETYNRDGYYITSTTVSSGAITIYRATEDEEGNMVPASTDKYVNSTGSAYSDDVYTETSDIKNIIYKMPYYSPMTTTNTLKVITPDTVTYGVSISIAVRNTSDDDSYYYVYARGRRYYALASAAEAIEAANDLYGLVVDARSTFIWGRVFRSSTMTLARLTYTAVDTDDSLLALLRTCLTFNGCSTDDIRSNSALEETLLTIPQAVVVDFSGGTVYDAVCFIYEGQPVITVIDGVYYLIYAYTGTLSSIDTMTVMNMSDGSTSTYTTSELDSIINSSGDIFVGITVGTY